eukprot:3526032-Alexandrium_andersonii.AAC.1
MSASLVGSEMCIRDRDKGGYQMLTHTWLMGRKVVTLLDGGAAVNAVTVSYTHLTLPTICSV